MNKTAIHPTAVTMPPLPLGATLPTGTVQAMRLDDDACRSRLATARIGILGSAGADGRPHLVPVVFAVTVDELLIPVDTIKAKDSTRLRRMANLERVPAASLLVDHRSDDWSELWWVRADLVYLGRASLDDAAPLRAKYEQYRAADSIADVLRLRIDRLSGWKAG